MKVLAYTRVSTKKQQSLEAQKDAIIQLAVREGISIDDINFYSETGSGSNDKRKQYQAMLEQLQDDSEVTTLLVYRLNRIGRNLKHTLEFLDICQNKRIKVISVSDGIFDLSKAFDRFKLQVISALAEMELDNISTFVKNGNLQKIREGQMISTNAPFGYIYQDGTYIIQEDEAKIVRFIYDRYIQGKGYKAISKELQQSGTLVPEYQVRNILLNPSYTGVMKTPYGIELNGLYRPIISQTTFKEAASIRNRKRIATQQTKSQLKKFLKCPCCGSTLTTHQVKRNDKTHYYYVCRNHKKTSMDYCPFVSINGRDIEDNVLQTIQSFLVGEKTYKPIKQAIERIRKDQIKMQSNSEKLRAKLVEQLAEGKISADEFAQQVNHKSETIKSIPKINSSKLTHILKNISNRLTLEEIKPYLDHIAINECKELKAVYLKNYPVNLVSFTQNQSH
ncbi:recombinase family protein [Macrococcoides bohemicum]|uniref:recombinase family protein n=1 Tax=Macrococcoides bohemicum TaxID=1903056 RepID=UPI00193F5BF0|nr:recombinase family protein [Macrococcus bohemicus]QRN48674.1 cassette chromosome recombinase Am3 [Macrococcus bohemicus]